MKKSRFTEHQIVSILKEAEAGVPVKDVRRKHGSSSPTYYKWKPKYGGLSASDLKRLKELESELAQYKRMYAELAQENYALKDVIEKALTAPEKRQFAETLVAKHKLTIAGVCRASGLSRAAWYRPPADRLARDADVIDDFNREGVAIEVDTSITGPRLIRLFEQLTTNADCPICFGLTMARSSWTPSSPIGAMSRA